MMEEHEKQDLYRLLVARSDLTAALAATRYILEHVKRMSDDLWIPLQDAAIISYARPFTANKPFGPLPKAYATFDSPSLQKIHDNVIELRHKTIAHSDAHVRRVVVVPSGVELGPVAAGPKGAVAVSTKKLPLDAYRGLEELCMDVGRRVNKDADLLSDKLLSSERLPDHAFDLMTDERVDS